jgi:hypothetical protein
MVRLQFQAILLSPATVKLVCAMVLLDYAIIRDDNSEYEQTRNPCIFTTCSRMMIQFVWIARASAHTAVAEALLLR